MIVSYLRALTGVLVMAGVVVLAGIGTAVAQTPKHGGTLVYGVESEIPWYDPHVVFGGSNKRVVLQIFEGLVDRDRTQEGVVPPLIPKLASSWDVSPDGKVYTFQLRKGVPSWKLTPWPLRPEIFA